MAASRRGDSLRVVRSPPPVTAHLRGASASPATERVAQAGAQELALAPDGKKLAFIVRGEVFAASSKPEAGETAFRVTSTPALEEELAWSPDSRQLVYASDRGGSWRLFLYDFPSRTERALAEGVSPRWSPDGKEIAFTRGGRELRVVDRASPTTRGRTWSCVRGRST